LVKEKKAKRYVVHGDFRINVLAALIGLLITVTMYALVKNFFVVGYLGWEDGFAADLVGGILGGLIAIPLVWLFRRLLIGKPKPLPDL